MPRGKTSGGKPLKRPIERYEHTDKKRVNNPPVGLVTPETDPVAPTHKVYDYIAPVPSVKPRQELDYDPHLDPQLVWLYADMRSNNNRVTPERAYLSAVSTSLKKLQSTQKLTQEALEQATGVDQTTISRAKSGKLKRVTPKIRCVKRYADMRLGNVRLSTEVLNAAKAFLAAGGSEDELLASLRHVTRFVLRRGAEQGGTLEEDAR